MRGIAFLALVLALTANNAWAAEPPLQEGIAAALKTFGELREQLTTAVAPGDRAEATRALTKLSECLDSLVRSKRVLTENLVSAQWPQGKNRTIASAQAFKEEVRKTRMALADVFAPLSAEWQSRGGDVLVRLNSGFNGKWKTLDDAARELGLPDASSEQFRTESEQLISAAQQLKQLVEGIAGDLAK